MFSIKNLVYLTALYVLPAAAYCVPNACLADPKCAQSGFNIDYYYNAYGYEAGYGIPNNGVSSNYTIIQGLKPLASSLTNITGFPQGGDGPDPRLVNGGLYVNPTNFTLVYSGLYRAPETGTYQLCAGADNEADVFFGDGNAWNCQTGLPSAAPPPLSKNYGGNYNNPVGCVSVNMTAGQYYPIRIVMGNPGGSSQFTFLMKRPNTQQTSDFTGFVYPVNCGVPT